MSFETPTGRAVGGYCESKNTTTQSGIDAEITLARSLMAEDGKIIAYALVLPIKSFFRTIALLLLRSSSTRPVHLYFIPDLIFN